MDLINADRPGIADGSTVIGPKTFQIRQLTSRYLVVAPGEDSCKSSACYYRLLDLKEGAVKEDFSFRGTGVIWFILSRTEVRLD